jgi:hypothetical protein
VYAKVHFIGNFTDFNATTASNPSRSRSLIELLPHRMKMSSVLTPELNVDSSGILKLGSFSLVMIILPLGWNKIDPWSGSPLARAGQIRPSGQDGRRSSVRWAVCRPVSQRHLVHFLVLVNGQYPKPCEHYIGVPTTSSEKRSPAKMRPIFGKRKPGR